MTDARPTKTVDTAPPGSTPAKAVGFAAAMRWGDDSVVNNNHPGGTNGLQSPGPAWHFSAASGERTIFIAGDPRLSSADGEAVTGSEACARKLDRALSAGKAPEDLGLGGPYAIAIHDTRSSTVTLVTDRFASIPLYFRVDPDGISFATDLSELCALDSRSDHDRIDAQATYDYLYFHMVPAPRAIIQGMEKLRAAEVCRIGKDGAVERRKHWLPDFREQADVPRKELEASLKSTLRGAVAECISTEGTTGAFLSGGLDSSTVAGMLAEIQGHDTVVFAIGFDAEGYDEMPYARLAAKHFGVRLVERYVTPDDVVSALPEIARGFDEPFGNSSALPAYFCARAAKDEGVGTLLAGDGGDELFAGNGRYAQRRVFQRYAALPSALRSSIAAMVRLMPHSLPLARKAQSFIDQSTQSTAERLQRYNFLHQNQPEAVFETEFLAGIDTSRCLNEWRDTFEAPRDGTSELNRMLFLDWQYTLADNDLRKVNRACELAGVRVRYPLLADSLVDLSTRIPSDWKLEPGNLRAFYKSTLTGWLPDSTIQKSKHGFGLPFGVWMREHKPLAELAYDSIGALKQRDIFQPAFLEKAVRLHREGHAAYYGELVWLLTVLELWLQQHTPRA